MVFLWFSKWYSIEKFQVSATHWVRSLGRLPGIPQGSSRGSNAAIKAMPRWRSSAFLMLGGAKAIWWWVRSYRKHYTYHYPIFLLAVNYDTMIPNLFISWSIISSTVNSNKWTPSHELEEFAASLTWRLWGSTDPLRLRHRCPGWCRWSCCT